MKKECYSELVNDDTIGCQLCRHYETCWGEPRQHMSLARQMRQRLRCMFVWAFAHIAMVFGSLLLACVLLSLCSCTSARDLTMDFDWQRDTIALQSLADDSLSFRGFDWEGSMLHDRYAFTSGDARWGRSGSSHRQHDRSVVRTSVIETTTTTIDSLGNPVVTQVVERTDVTHRDVLSECDSAAEVSIYSTRQFWHTMDSISALIHATKLELDRMRREEANARYDSMMSHSSQRSGDAARTGWQTLSRSIASWQWGVALGILICIILYVVWRWMKRIG